MSPKPASEFRRGVKRLRMGHHLSFFRKHEEYYVYHDLWGYLLAMDRQPLELLRAFGPQGRAIAEVQAEFSGRLRPEQIESYLATFRSHGCLVPLRHDERSEAFARGHPVRAPWTVAWLSGRQAGEAAEQQARQGVLAYRDRALGRVVLQRLGEFEARLFELCDGERTLAELAELLAPHAGGPEAARHAVARFVFSLTHSYRQVLKLLDRPRYTYLSLLPAYVRSSMPFARLEEAELQELPAPAPSRDVVDLSAYHREGIADAAAQFDLEETTLSHMFREPHPALGGRSYGEAFAQALLERNLVPRQGEVVEVGGGVGFFALRLLETLERLAPAHYAGLRYTTLDLSAVLQESQRLLTSALGAKVRHVLADASRGLPLRDASAALVLSNEVIADLETVRLRRRELEAGAPPAGAPPSIRAAHALLGRYGIGWQDAPEVFWLNLGALRLVEEIARVLRPGGAAVLTEFGALDRYPIESTHLEHGEFSIHFGHLIQLARAVGLQVEHTDIIEFLGMRTQVPVLATTRSHFLCLRALLQRRGVSLQKLAYSREQFEALCRERIDPGEIEGLRFLPAGERVLGLRPREFQVLILRRPA
ncbi:MAG: hypothetical protein KatS3mg102_1239 [Planctomycetota bacterium]|nr:MAG: hypothetical protein KatS3mg102_1239 [Planctomycetota bacterium]